MPPEVALITTSNARPRQARRSPRLTPGARPNRRLAFGALRCGWRRPARRARVEQRPDHALRRAAGAEQQRRRTSQSRLRARSRTSPTPSVLSPRIRVPSKRSVLTASPPRARSRACARAGRPRLERHRDVEPLAALGANAPPSRRSRRAAPRAAVLQVLPGRARERGVDLRRPGVRDRVADDGVAVDAHQVGEDGAAVHRGRELVVEQLVALGEDPRPGDHQQVGILADLRRERRRRAPPGGRS